MKQVRLANENDIDFIMEAFTSCDYERVLTDDSAPNILYAMNSGQLTGFVLTNNGRAEACIFYSNDDDVAYLDGLYRKPDAEGSGRSDLKLLFRYAVSILKGIGFTTIKGTISSANPNINKLIKVYNTLLGAVVVSVEVRADVDTALARLEA